MFVSERAVVAVTDPRTGSDADRLDGVARRGPLLWSGSPSLADLERVLRSQIGRVIQDIGLVEIDAEPGSDEKPVAEIAHSAPPWST